MAKPQRYAGDSRRWNVLGLLALYAWHASTGISQPVSRPSSQSLPAELSAFFAAALLVRALL
eukprot:342010-Pleurochrysis_carterae.AAC.1